MSEKKYQVFLSSTYSDLKAERKIVIYFILDSGNIFAGMERFPASDMDRWDYIQRVLDNTDYFILLSAGKYGSWFADKKERISWTEREFDYAVEKRIPILSFIRDDVDSLPANLIEKDVEKQIKLKNFHLKIMDYGSWKNYSNQLELLSRVSASLPQASENNPRIGWFRGNQIIEDANGSLKWKRI